jgi:serine/threonine-protein kinase
MMDLNDLYNEARDEAGSKNDRFESMAATDERYEFRQLLGVGSTKRVSCVFDTFTCRDIALAEPANEAGQASHDSFLHEARLTSQLDHPAVIKVHDVGLDPSGQPFFTMDLKSGDSLHDLIKKLQDRVVVRTQSERLEIFLKICDGVAYAHSKGIIHLDLKPANIQVGDYGEVVICDWGLGTTIGQIELADMESSRFVQDLLLTKPVDRRAGTPGYMAPEQYHRDRCKDTRTDVFGLGAILYCLLTLEAPYSGSVDAIQSDTEAGKIPALLNDATQLPEALSSIVGKAMATASDDRYASATQMADDIRLYLTGYTPSAEDTGFRQEFVRLIRRNQRVSMTIAASLLIVLLLSGVFVSRLNESRMRAESARAETQDANAALEVSLQQAETARSEAQQANAALQESLQQADAARRQAEEALAKYEQEKASLDNIARDGVKQAIHQAWARMPAEPVENIAVLRRILTPRHDVNSRRMMARVHIVALEFAEASAIYEALGQHADSRLAPIATLMSQGADEQSKNEQLTQALRLMKEHDPRGGEVAIRMVMLDLASRDDFSTYEPILRAQMEFFWPDWDGDVSYDGKTLKVSRGIDRFSKLSPLLRELPVEVIDVSNTEFYFIDDLSGAPRLRTLDLRYTNIRLAAGFPPKGFPALEEMILSRGRYRPFIDERITVTVRK